MAKGNAVLKIAGILLIIFGVFGILFAMMYGFVGALNFEEMGKTILTGLLIFYGLYGVLTGFFQIATGAVAIRHSNRPERWNRGAIWGIVMLVVGAICYVLLMVTSSRIHADSEFYPPWFAFVIMMLGGIIMPLLMILGGALNKITHNKRKAEAADMELDAVGEGVQTNAETEAVKADSGNGSSTEHMAYINRFEMADEDVEMSGEPQVNIIERGKKSGGNVLDAMGNTSSGAVNATGVHMADGALTAGGTGKPIGRLAYLKSARLSRNVDPRLARKFGKR